MTSGHRESEESWAEVLRDLKKRGLNQPRLVVADGHLGIWGAASRVWPKAEQQRCWNHKLRNVIDKLAKKDVEKAKAMLKSIPYAETVAEAERRRDDFIRDYEGRAPKATACLAQDWERLVTFYRFPQEHWKHLRTSNVIESPFASLRLRTDARGATARWKTRPRCSGSCCSSPRRASGNWTTPNTCGTSSQEGATRTGSSS